VSVAQGAGEAQKDSAPGGTERTQVPSRNERTANSAFGGHKQGKNTNIPPPRFTLLFHFFTSLFYFFCVPVTDRVGCLQAVVLHLTARWLQRARMALESSVIIKTLDVLSLWCGFKIFSLVTYRQYY
jgi:hypothetical protein